MAEEKLERIFTVNLADAYAHIRTKRSKRAVSLLKAFLSQHLKIEQGSVRLSNKVNAAVLKRGMNTPLRSIKVRVVKEAGVAKIYLPDEKPEETKVEEKKKEVIKPEIKDEKGVLKTADEKKVEEIVKTEVKTKDITIEAKK